MPAEAKDTFSAALIENSDIITFHNYLSLNHLVREIVDLRTYRRPLICTEWMARTLDSTFKTHLPVFKRERVGCYCWGLVSGKTQTHIPWGWVADQQELDPVMWFHDVFRADGTPYHAEEIQVLQAHTARSES